MAKKKNIKRICSKCGEEKILTNDFYYIKRVKKYSRSCKQCNNKSSTQYQKTSGYRKTVKYVFYQRGYHIKSYSKTKGILCDNDIGKYFEYLWEFQEQKCYYTKIKMALTGYHYNLYATTVDRKIPEKGYVKDNVVLCLSIINRMKQNLIYEDFIKWCNIIIQNQLQER